MILPKNRQNPISKKNAFFLFVWISFFGFSQDSFPIEQDIMSWKHKYEIKFPKDSLLAQQDTMHWTHKNEAGFDLSQVSFVNWNIGGENSISGLLKLRLERRYDKNMLSWDNDLNIRYGINKQEDREMRKTDDIFQFVSTVGYKMSKESKWSYSSKFNFNTQFTNGYAYPDTKVAISHTFAPAYIFLGIGADYSNIKKKKNEKINFYLSPLTLKSTIVLNQRLANQGAFGIRKATYDANGNLIEKGKLHKTEVGILLANRWKKEIYENITFENQIQFFSDYFNHFGNIDVDWQTQFEFIVNKYVKASISVHLIYDNDVKARKEIAGEMITVGPKIQLKQTLALGIFYSW